MTEANCQFEGVYGSFAITEQDRREVHRYRIALLVSGLALSAGLLQWWQLGSELAWLWVLPLASALGLALRWIHIYLRPLHQALKLFWLLGCLGWCVLLALNGPAAALTTLQRQPLWILAIGPLFAAMAGIGFKEFFCFRRPEAIGLTLLLPIALLGRLINLLPADVCLALLTTAALLLVMMAIRKFGMDPAADIGDKSVFAYLEAQRNVVTP
ncbi:hypothetical protein SynPROS71_02378 [Synechococcus sp. PROS-7-1]|uniref:DUF2301 domain-containing membrane protein n=1 Tax=Synechococcus sp. PROS-7-1 TaxID=1442556 RepID=UPI0016458F1B|nr:DUF2301 domain-containing membrane protein [Synechococcus sp. PROS-7-1]QNI86143.1 hypothetical protein SynPROS71_02378 [Synechococcus sp. PROS-7-1]